MIKTFFDIYGQRYGEVMESSEARIRVQTIRVASFVDGDVAKFDPLDTPSDRTVPAPLTVRDVHFVGHAVVLKTSIYDVATLKPKHMLPGPAIVTTETTIYLVELDWRLEPTPQGCGMVPSRRRGIDVDRSTEISVIQDRPLTAEIPPPLIAFPPDKTELTAQEREWHHIAPCSAHEETCIALGVDPPQIDRIRKRLAGALDEGYEMCEAMGAAPTLPLLMLQLDERWPAPPELLAFARAAVRSRILPNTIAGRWVGVRQTASALTART